MSTIYYSRSFAASHSYSQLYTGSRLFNAIISWCSAIRKRAGNAKKGVALSLMGLFSGSLAVSAQIVNKDSLSLVKRISEEKGKLVKLQNNIPELTKDKQKTAEQAQESADDNRKAANKLSNDPQDRKLARKADNEASDARSDAKKARKATDRLEDANKNIRDLTEKIAKEESKLNKYVLEYKAAVEAKPKPMAMPKDSAH